MSDFELGYLAATILALALAPMVGVCCFILGHVKGDKILHWLKEKSKK